MNPYFLPSYPRENNVQRPMLFFCPLEMDDTGEKKAIHFMPTFKRTITFDIKEQYFFLPVELHA